jgi:hypothetical protein
MKTNHPQNFRIKCLLCGNVKHDGCFNKTVFQSVCDKCSQTFKSHNYKKVRDCTQCKQNKPLTSYCSRKLCDDCTDSILSGELIIQSKPRSNKPRSRIKRNSTECTNQKKSSTKPQSTRTCSKCKNIKPIKKFYKEPYGSRGNVCTKCIDTRKKEHKSLVKSTNTTGKVDTFKKSYLDYINSAAWRRKRKEYWNSETLRECYICSDPWLDFAGKELHHRTYERLGNENLDDLVPVCPSCHQKVTEAWNKEKTLSKKNRSTLWEVTDLVRFSHLTRQLDK